MNEHKYGLVNKLQAAIRRIKNRPISDLPIMDQTEPPASAAFLGNREIAFRGISESNDEWVYGLLSVVRMDDGELLPVIVDKNAIQHYIKTETATEFTGLYDKDGKAIWEGDILEIDGDTNFPDTIGLVVWGALVARFRVKAYPNSYMDSVLGWGCKVIGNIFEHRELLEVDQ